MEGLINAQIALGKQAAAETRIVEMQSIVEEFRLLNGNWWVVSVLLRLGRLLARMEDWQAAHRTLIEAAAIAGKMRIPALEVEIGRALVDLPVGLPPEQKSSTSVVQ